MQINKKKIYEQLKINPKNVRFEALCKAAELFGFRFREGKGSHKNIRQRWCERNVEFPEC